MIESTTTFVQVLEAHAAKLAEKRAFAFTKDNSDFAEELSYLALRERACRVAAALRAEGVKEGAPVVLLFPAGLDFIGALFGCFYAGAIAVPATDPYRLNRTQTRLTSICSDAGVSVGLTVSSVLTQLDSLHSQAGMDSIKWLAVDAFVDDQSIEPDQAHLTADTLAVIQYTSGSTSRPKGVALTHRNLLYNQQLIEEAVAQTERSTFAGWLPPYHDMGLIGLILHPVYLGAQSILMSTFSFLRHPFRWLEVMSRYRATASAAPNFAFDLCVERTTEDQRRTLDLSCLEAVVNGAEPVRKETLERFSKAFASCGFRREAFYPSYGLGEATLLVTGQRDIQNAGATEIASHVEGSRAVVSCGRPGSGLEVLIVDPGTRKRCADGSTGEIWVRGESVGTGYWNKPRQSVRTFSARLRSDGGKRFLRTGDLGFMRQGQLFVTGRRSDLIVVRGRNIHPEDLERTAETGHPRVLAHGGAAFSIDTTDGERICLVQEVRPGSAYEEIVAALRHSVANEHEVELYSVVLVRPNQIPRTSSGKIRRKACRDALAAQQLRELFRSDLGRLAEPAPDAVATRIDSVAATVRQIVAELLHIPATALELDQDIVSLGLDSLKAIQLQHAFEDRFGANVQTSDLFGASIQDVVELLGREMEKQPPASRRAEAIQPESFALTPGQSALWFEHERNPGSSAFHLGGALRIRGKLDARALAVAFDHLLDRHSSLRSRFEITQSVPWQRVGSPPSNTMVVHVATTLTDAEMREQLLHEFNRPFDLKTELPVRLQLYRIADREAVILFVVHHIVADLISLSILAKELSELYRAAVAGITAKPLDQALAYADYVEWYDGLLSGLEGKSLAAFWHTELAGEVPVPALPQAHAETNRALRPARLRQRIFSDSLLREIEALARKKKITRFVLLLGAFKILLHRYTQQTDIAVGTPVAVRPHSGFMNTVGYFVNMLAIRSEVCSADRCEDYLRRLQETMVRALDHSAYPFSRVLQDRRRAGTMDAVSLMPVVFNYYSAGESPDLAALVQPPQLNLEKCEVEALPLERLHSQFDLSFSVAESDKAVTASVEYNADLYTHDFVDRLLGHFEMVLTDLVRNPSQPISRVSMLTGDEYVELDHWNETTVRYDEVHVLHRLIEQQVDREPDAIGVSCEDRSLTYAELDRKSTDLACYLVACGAGPERPVAVLLPPGLDVVTNLLGILKAGAAYMPIDPDGAPERIERILKQAAPALVLTTSDAANEVRTSVPIVCLDQLTLPPSISEGRTVLPEVQPQDLAYIMHTSGSTGEPKGVMISHEAICNRLLWMRDQYRPAKTDRILQKTPYTFDVSVWELFLPLITGVELVTVKPGGYRDPAYLINLIRRRRITILHFVPSMLELFLDEPHAEECDSLRLVICSGEPLSPALRDRFFATSRAELHNLYGPTEAAVDVTYWPCERHEASAVVPIGHPIANIQLFILDPCLNRVPVGIAGELYIAGTGLARGYWRRPDLAETVFKQISLNGDGPLRVYATGDRARYLPDGSIQFLGRLDDQVKIHGVRVEPGEVEAVLRRHPAIGSCVVTAFNSNGDGLRLAAYLVKTPDLPSAGELRRFLGRNLAPAFIPSAICVVDSLPTTSSGKVKRSALPAPSACQTLPRAECEPPEIPMETLLAGIWREVLELEQVGVNENFFELGGDSLRLLQVRNRALQAGIAFSVEDLFQHPTIRELAPLLKTISGVERQAATTPFSQVRPEVRAKLENDFEDAFPLTKTQEALLFHSQSENNYEIYLLSITVASVFCAELFNEAVATIVSRHPMFRVSYNYWDFKEFLQVVHREVTAPVKVFDLTSQAEPEQEEIIDQWIKDESHHNFDWATPPLIRFHVHLRSAKSFQLTVSHAFYDGWSLSSAIVELLREYLARINDAVSPLAPAPAAAFRDFVAAEQTAINDHSFGEFWRTKLAAAPPACLRPRSIRKNLNATGIVRRILVIAPQITAGLRQLAKSAQAPLKSVLLALHLRVMSQLTGRREVMTGLITNGRLEQPDGDRVVGLFLNTVPLQIKLGSESWRELARLTFQAEQELWPFRRYPLAEMRSLLGTTPFDTAFNYVNFHVYNQLRGQDELRITGWKNPSDLTYFPLCAYFTEDPVGSRLLFYLDYDRTLFESSEIERIINYYEKAFALAATEPEAIAVNQDLRSEAELAAEHEWNQAAKNDKQPTRTTLQLFEAWAARKPESTAVVSGAKILSYAEINASANRLARCLRELGVTNNVPVGVRVDRTPELLIAILGILKSGGAFVSLNPTLPDKRLSDIELDCGLKVIVVAESHSAEATPGVIEVPVTGVDLNSYSTDNPDYDISFADLAYVMYTSGSTGRPKGVEITHGNLVNVLLSVGDQIAISEADKWLAVTSISFDISVLEFLLPLISGAQIELADATTIRDGIALKQLLTSSGATIMQATPSLWRLILEAGWEGSERLRILCGGEALTRRLAGELLCRCQVLWNVYGPTETTIWSMISEVTAGDDEPSIGRALANTMLYVLDEAGEPVPVGVPGELYIGGLGVARGYRNRSKETARRFLPDPFSTVAGARMYRTGDMVVRRADGSLDFVGRLDGQLKIRGHRVEVGEIESTLRSHAGIREAVVTIRRRTEDDVQLIAYVLRAAGQMPAAASLKEFVARRLPAYMLPAEIIFVDQFQLNANGKIDRDALPQQTSLPESTAHVGCKPVGETENVIAGIWRELLELEAINRHQNLFHLGAHSLLVMRCCVKIKQELNLICGPTEIFRYPTVAGIAAYLNSDEMKTSLEPATLETGDTGLSPTMQAMIARRRDVWSAGSAASD